jgi:uncharacterized protein
MHVSEHIAGVTAHSRRGAIKNAFSYTVDFVLIDPEAPNTGPILFSRNRFNLFSVNDRDHGGPLKKGRGASWARAVLAEHGLEGQNSKILLLTQPSFLGYAFNPVSFWLVMEEDALVAAIAEVSTPFGDRHSYLCSSADFAPISHNTRITAPKALHVSPFQEVAGKYAFSFDIRPDRIAIRIFHQNLEEGLVATLAGPRATLTNMALIKSALRRPLGAMRTVALIYWQALRLKLKGAQYRSRPALPKTEVS